LQHVTHAGDTLIVDGNTHGAILQYGAEQYRSYLNFSVIILWRQSRGLSEERAKFDQSFAVDA